MLAIPAINTAVLAGANLAPSPATRQNYLEHLLPGSEDTLVDETQQGTMRSISASRHCMALPTVELSVATLSAGE